MHLPKTAGTSLRTALHQNFDQNLIFPNKEDMKNLRKPYSDQSLIKTGEPEVIKNLKLINGHYPFNIQEHLEKPYIITFLRCPIQRTISNILHFKSYIPKFRNKSILFLLEELPAVQVSNCYTRYLSNSYSKNKEVAPKDLKRAEINLRRVDFVGFLSNYKTDLERLSNETGLDLTMERRKNVNKKSYKIPNRIMKKIIEINTYDLMLYNNYIHDLGIKL